MVIEVFHGVWCLRLVRNVSRRAVSKRKPGYVAEERARAGAKPDSLISGNRLCGPHLTGIVRTWLVWEPSLVSHDIHGLRPPRGQHGDPIPCQLFDLRTANLNISEKEIHVYFILVCRRRNDIAGGVGACDWTTRNSASKGSSTSQPMKFNVVASPGIEENPRKFPLATVTVNVNHYGLWRNFNSIAIIYSGYKKYLYADAIIIALYIMSKYVKRRVVYFHSIYFRTKVWCYWNEMQNIVKETPP